MGKREVRKLLEAATESRGFSKRGDAFFRILGDGVLQVLKFEYEPCFTHYSLNVGLFSMYSELRESWFTSSGCIPRYCVMNFAGKQNAINVKTDENNIYTFNVISPEAQIQTLEESAFPVLDSIRDQTQLVRQIAQLDIASGETVRWNDMEKLAPYLKSGDLKSAEKVLRAILQQHQSVCSHSPLPEVVDSICKEDRTLIQKLEWVEREDWKSINAYLERNKERNNRFARNIRPR